MAATGGHRDVVAWLRALPESCEIAWSDDAARASRGFGYGFIDAYVPLLVEDLGWNWVWSIFPSDEERAEEEEMHRDYLASQPAGSGYELRFHPGVLADLGIAGITVEVEGEEGWEAVERAGLSLEDLAAELGVDLEALVATAEAEREDDPLNLTLPYDATLEIVFQGERCRGAYLSPDDGPPRELAPELLDVEGLRRGHARSVRREGELEIRSRRVWTLEALEAALEEWVSEQAGRDDLVLFCRDDAAESPLMRRVRARLEADGAA